MAAVIHSRVILRRVILHSRGMGTLLHRYVVEGSIVFGAFFWWGGGWKGTWAGRDRNKKNRTLTGNCRCNTAPRLPPRKTIAATKDV